ncbi:1440_t:CDS:2 [Paraglomus occultum]|uniref:1440_t:CDS:1 n=1 Tax=Paraglomus occultum TaxID=144539 RepID=A0A9N8VNC5_9GLOM|nr:1440_t:CDS:2 [Paraglomus occultum]
MTKDFNIKFHNQGLKLSKGDEEYEVRTKDGKEVKVEFKDDAKKGIKLNKKELESGKELKEEIKPESLVKEEDFDSFIQNNHDKLVLVKFSTVWCSPCQVLQKNIKELLTELEKSTERGKKLVVMEVDAEKFPRLAQRPQFRGPVGEAINTYAFHAYMTGLTPFNGRTSAFRSEYVGSIPAASAKIAQIAQLVDAAGLRSAKCRFESGFGYHGNRFCSVLVNTPPCHGGDSDDTQAETDGNHIIIKGEVEAKSKLEVSVVDEKGSQIRRFVDVKPGEQKYEEATKEMHKKLLEEKFPDKIRGNNKHEAEGVDMKYTILGNGQGGYKVKIYHGDTGDDWEFPWEKAVKYYIMPGRSINIYLQEETYNQLRQVAGGRKISRFINEAVVEKLNKELEKDRENFQQRLIRGYQAMARNKKLKADLAVWKETLSDSYNKNEPIKQENS